MNTVFSQRRSVVSTVSVLTAAVILTSSVRSFAPPPPPILLTDANSSALVDPATQGGMLNWTVDGQNQLAKQWFWYRIGAASPEFSINTISIPNVSHPLPNTLSISYTHAAFTIQVDYTLTGGTFGSGLSQISESIQIINTTTTNLDFHFFQYSDFNLGNTPGDDVLQLGTNIFGLYNVADQVDSTFGHFQETVLTPGANRGQAALVPSILNSLNDGGPTTLSNATGPVGPGDVSWGFQWDVTIAPSDTFLLSKLKSIELAPEPSSIALGLLGLAGIQWMRRRRV